MAHWRFEEGAGPIASDSSGGGNPGTLVGPTWQAETPDGSAHALNFDRVINTVLRGDYARMHTFNEGFGEYDNTMIRQRPFDLDKSREYLVASGWVKRGPDGILVKDGQRLSIRITYGAPHHTERLVILREEAKKAGIELELQLLDSATSFKQMLEKKHQVAWMAWGSQGLSPRYWQFWHSDNAHKPQTNNLMNHDDPAMDAMIDEYRAATDKARRVELAHALERDPLARVVRQGRGETKIVGGVAGVAAAHRIDHFPL